MQATYCSAPFQLSSRRNLADAKWLLFLTEDSVDSFFAGINVPFDCEFLVARPTAAGVSLYEVFRVAEGTRLNDAYFGRWSSSSGLVATQSSIYKRRGDLQGTVINAVAVDVSGSASLPEPRNAFCFCDGHCGHFQGLNQNSASLRLLCVSNNSSKHTYVSLDSPPFLSELSQFRSLGIPTIHILAILFLVFPHFFFHSTSSMLIC
jgi:hypothetical protein